jgi:hypothetical protein
MSIFVNNYIGMKQKLLRNWNFMRITRLLLGILIIVQSVLVKDWIMGFLGLFFTALPLLNIGCCGASGCAIPGKKNSAAGTKEITYEEVA